MRRAGCVCPAPHRLPRFETLWQRRDTAEADKVKNAFDLDRLIDRRRRPGMNEECEVYEVSVPDEALTDEDEDILNYDDLDDPDAFV